MSQLKRTAQAEQDLLHIWSYISEENPVAAEKILRDLDARSHQLLTNPQIGPSREYIGTGFRHLVMGNYLILYRIAGADIEIVRYLHGARDLRTL